MHKYRHKHKGKYLERLPRSMTNSKRRVLGNRIMEHGFATLAVEQEDQEYSPEDSADSPSSRVFNDIKTTSTSSHKSKRLIKKRVISVPVTEIEGSRLKSEVNGNAPPSDSWTWRKYGQKPIKGSPYPRGYYRCSSSKGCPARKQVERNRADPTMVIVTYSCDHNHSRPASRNNNQIHHKISTLSPPQASNPTTTQEEISNTDDQEEDSGPPHLSKESIPKPELTNLSLGPFVTTTDQFGWFSGLETETMLESPLLVGDIVCDADMALIFSIRDEDEALFADLGELPECARVFKQREVINKEEHHRTACSLAPLCGTKG